VSHSRIDAALPTARQLLAVGPHAGAHRVALRAGASVAIPLLALHLLGRLDLSLYPTFGAFASLYGRADVHAARGRMQLSAATVLVACVALGTAVATSSARGWLIVGVAALVAAAASAVSDAARWHPPGALFPIFALAACAAVPSAPGRIPLAAAVAAASALVAVAIGVAGALRDGGARRTLVARAAAPPAVAPPAVAPPAVAPPAAAPPAAAPPAAAPPALAARVAASLGPALARVDRGDALRCGAVTLVAGALPTALGLGHPYWAMVAALAAVAGPDTTARLVRAGHRAAGTLLGVAAAALLLSLPLSPLGTIAAVVLLQCAAELLVGRNYGLALIAVTPLALLMVELAHPVGTATLLRDRAVETLLGAAIGAAATLAAHRRGDDADWNGGRGTQRKS